MYPHMIFSTIESRGAHLKFEPDEKLIERIHKITQIDAQSMNSPNDILLEQTRNIWFIMGRSR